MLAARELSVELPSKGGSWVNRHLQYTHGYGLAMCLAADKHDAVVTRCLLMTLRLRILGAAKFL